MNTEKHGAGAAAAWRMLLSFVSLGVERFDLTCTDLDQQLRAFHPGQTWAQLRRSLPFLLPSAIERRHNLIVRPRPATPLELVQLDDLDPAALERIGHAAFLILATSPHNYQAWVALRNCPPGGARALRQATGADPCASGAARLAGSVNFKRRYAPEFPVVRLVETNPHHILSPAELEPLLGPAAPAAASPPSAPPAPPSAARRWPSYQRCLQNAPLAHSRDRPDVSRADFTFCLLAIDWGWPVADTERRLLELSPKARVRGQPYASRTAERAAAALQRRLSHPGPA